VTYDGVIPDGLAERGTALWIDVLAERELDAAGRVLLAEACRMADRLEQMDRLLRGDIATWARSATSTGPTASAGSPSCSTTRSVRPGSRPRPTAQLVDHPQARDGGRAPDRTRLP
jgi:hypothetical protein